MKTPLACVKDYEENAKGTLDRNALDYYSSGANEQVTLAENRLAFTRYRIMPRILVDVRNIDMETTILGQRVSMPICVSPTAMQRMAHPQGELATATASSAAKTCMILSSWSSTSLEDVATANGEGLRWFQLYVYKDRQVVAQLVQRAEAAGYKAIALTVDAPLLGRRLADVRNKFKLPPHLTLANFAQSSDKATSVKSSSDSGLAAYVASQIDQSLDWDSFKWLKSITKLPIVVKGVLTAEDAVKSIEMGAAAIMVSNHGARQLDTSPATIEVLPEIVAAVAGRVEVYLDGGVTLGTDALKALALGARAVFVGRPVLWGLAYDGAAGVSSVLNILREELRMAMALSGVVSLQDLHPHMIRAVSSFYKSHL